MQDKDNKFAGWEFQFIEDLPDLPAKGEGEEAGNRKQVEAGASPEEYLKVLETDAQYEGERGQTPEAELTEFISNLKVHNRVIDDWEGSGKISWNISGYFKSSGLICKSNWSRVFGQLELRGYDPSYHGGYNGCRVGVQLR